MSTETWGYLVTYWSLPITFDGLLYSMSFGDIYSLSQRNLCPSQAQVISHSTVSVIKLVIAAKQNHMSQRPINVFLDYTSAMSFIYLSFWKFKL